MILHFCFFIWTLVIIILLDASPVREVKDLINENIQNNAWPGKDLKELAPVFLSTYNNKDYTNAWTTTVRQVGSSLAWHLVAEKKSTDFQDS